MRTRRHVHAICRVASRPQSSRNLRSATVAAAGSGSILRFHHTPSGWAGPLPARIRNARGLSTPTSNSQAVAADSDQQLESALHKVGPPNPHFYAAFIFEALVRRGQLELHIDGWKDRNVYFATLKIPALGRRFHVRIQVRRWWTARRRLTLALVRQLKEAGLWEHIVQMYQEASNEEQVDIEPVNLRSADVDVVRDLPYLRCFAHCCNWLMQTSHSRLSNGNFTSVVVLRIHLDESTRKVITEGQGTSRELATTEALCRQILKLKEIGLWCKLTQELPIEARQHLDKVSVGMPKRYLDETPKPSPESSPGPSALWKQIMKLNEAGFWRRLIGKLPTKTQQGFDKVPEGMQVECPDRTPGPSALYKQIMKLREIGIWRKLIGKLPTKTQQGLDKIPEGTREGYSDETPKPSLEPLLADLSETPVSLTTDPAMIPSSENSEFAMGPEEEELLEIFHRMSQGSAQFKLDMEILKISDSHTCRVALTMLDGNTVVEATMSASRKKEAKNMALLMLLSKLQENGLWEELLHATYIPPKAEVAVHDDLFCNIQWAKDDLLQAEASLKKTLSKLTATTSELQPYRGLPSSYRNLRSSNLAKALAKFRDPQNPQAVAIRSTQATLPISGYRQSILDHINAVTFSIVVAETGSGKSTQLPQMILDNAIDQGNGADCRVLCVQPRRLAALFLAKRVAAERCETIGGSVGYAVGHDYAFPERGGSITYCTTGAMLNFMQGFSSGIGGYTHILLDEVHVRDMGIDLVMLLLKRYADLCRKRGKPAPKVVLMSATLDVERFSSYFRNEGPDGTSLPAPAISIPGRQYHVQKHYLSEVLASVRSSIQPGVLSSFLSEGATETFLKRQQEVFPIEDEIGLEAESDINCVSRGDLATETVGDESTGRSMAKMSPNESRPFSQANADVNPDFSIPYALIAATVFHVLQTTQTGAILVFLPGLQHILELRKTLSLLGSAVNLDMTDTNRFRILTLHSLVPEGQRELPHSVPEGCRRILLATDIAEASLTIPDVRYVIDSGRVNKLVYDNTRRASRMECDWISRSSALQRAGRAGRVENGHYYFIGDQRQFDSMSLTTTPAFLYSNLQDVCLATKTAVPHAPIAKVLQEALDPPDKISVHAAVNSLKWLKAIDEHENLTNLGRILARLPLSAPFGKLVLMGVIFRCLDPMLIIAANGNGAQIFRVGTTTEEKKKIMHARATFAGQSASDHIAGYNAFRALRALWLKEDRAEYQAFTASMSFRLDSHRTLFSSACRTLRTLARENLISSECVAPPNSDFLSGSEFNTNSQNFPLIKALLLHCLSPQIGAPRGPTSKNPYCTDIDENVFFSKWRLSLRPKNLPLALVTYSGKIKLGTEMKLDDVSLVSPLVACLFGGDLKWEGGSFMLNDWLKIALNVRDGSVSNKDAATNMIELQSALDKSLTTMVDSLLLRRSHRAVRGKKFEERIHEARRTLNESLERAVTGVLNRDLYGLESRQDSLPSKWEAPELDEELELDEGPTSKHQKVIQ